MWDSTTWKINVWNEHDIGKKAEILRCDQKMINQYIER